ncbi:MAG: ATPase, partial [Clostridia bacterium]|nr:ATPase [Clostridia bacterium]
PDRERMETIRATLSTYWENQDRLYDRVYTFLKKQSRLCDIRKYAALNGHRFILIGWVPKSEVAAFEKAFEQLSDVEVSHDQEEIPETLSPPVRLKNSFFARPFEFYTKMFGMPSSGEIDPTPFVAITYTLLYGIMFADLGQGLLLAIIGYFFMYKMKGMELGRLLVPCGISGALFGLVFGSVFGYEHLLDPMYHALGFHEKPIEIMDSENILTILFGAVGIGVLLMVIALIISIYSNFKRKNIGKACFSENGIVGLVFYVSAIVLVLNMVLGLSLPTLPLVLGGIILPLILLWVKEPLEKLANREKDWQPEGWGGAITQGFFELFEGVLSYVTNTVSFLRVGAFVLVHAGMMMVFMSLAEMAGSAGIILVIFGNIFVLALEGLLVGVQSLRLEFYEMFNRFFEGAGREFSPLQLKQ